MKMEVALGTAAFHKTPKIFCFTTSLTERNSDNVEGGVLKAFINTFPVASVVWDICGNYREKM